MAAEGSDPDEALLTGVGRGDPAAVRQLLDRRLPRVLALARRMLNDAGEAEDVAQETFISAFKSLPDFETGRDFGAWLNGIARHRILEHLRARGRRMGAMERFQSEVTGRVESELSACQTAQTDDRLERLLECIERLPARLLAQAFGDSSP